MTVNNTAENNGTMNDSGAKVPIRLPFAAENTMADGALALKHMMTQSCCCIFQLQILFHMS
jgi:hypothetical protein